MSHEAPVRFLGRVDGDRPAPGGAKELESDDPYELVGVRYPVPEGVDADRELARCFVEEFALMGWHRDRIRELFTNPLYAGAHEIARRRGPALIDEVLAATFGDRDAEEARR